MPDFFKINVGDWARQVERARREHKTMTARAAKWATDQASRRGRDAVAQKMRSVGLGRLGGAVGQTSTLRTGSTRGIGGVIYARGGRQSDNRGAGAIEAYTRGTVIRPTNGNWLAYPTNAVPKMVSAAGRRRRLTPANYQLSGLQARLGKLEFRPISATLALLVVKNVTVSPKTGRAKAAGKRPSRTRINQKEIVVFVLIRFTRRAQRLDEKQIIFPFAKMVPELMEEFFRHNAR